MKKLIANIYLKKPVINILPESFEEFLYIAVNIEYQKHTLFTWSLLYISINSLDNIITNLNIINNNNFILCHNRNDLILFKYQIICQYNWPLIAIIALVILYYI